MPKILTDREIQDFRDRICRIALRQFSEKGIENTSIRSIASEAGCSSMTPYRHFKDKSELLAAVRTQGFKQFIDSVEAVIATPQKPLKKMLALADAYFDFAIEQNDLYRLMFESRQSDEESFPELQIQLTRLQQIWHAAADVGEQTNMLKVDPAMASQLFWVGLHGLVSLHVSDCLSDKYSFTQLADELIMTLFVGMAHRDDETS